MKPQTIALIVLACAGLSPLHGGETAEAEGVSPRPTHALLAARMAKRTNPLADHRRVTSVDRADYANKERTPARSGFIKRSHIISFGGHWTLVPKGAILHLPPALQGRVTSKPAGKLLPWKEFYSRNRGWIFAQSVQLEHARGERALGEDVLNNHKQLGRLVVAVLHHGPISVKAPQPPQ